MKARRKNMRGRAEMDYGFDLKRRKHEDKI